MAEILGAVSGAAGLGAVTFETALSLYNLIQSFRHQPKYVRDLLQGLEELQGVLRPVIETTSTDLGIDISALETPLQRCTNACKEFEQEIIKNTSRSGGDRTSFRDWAKLRYMGEDIDGFRRQLSGYQLTICVALADANLRKSSLTAQEIEDYQRLLLAATDDLEAHLQSMEGKLEAIFEHTVAENDEDAAELRRLKEEHLSTQKSLEICAQLSKHIDQVQASSKQQDSQTESFASSTVPQKVIDESLRKCKDNLTTASSTLEAHMRDTIHRMVSKSKTTLTSKEDITHLARIWDELETTFKRREMFSEAESRLNENISVIENYGTGDARQVMVATDDGVIHGKNWGRGWRSLQVGGRMSEAALQDVVRTMSSLSDRARDDHQADDDQPPSQTATPTATNQTTDDGRHAKFRDQYGPGVRLTPVSCVGKAGATADLNGLLSPA